MRACLPLPAVLVFLAVTCASLQGSVAGEFFKRRMNDRSPAKRPTHLGHPKLDTMKVSVEKGAKGEDLKVQQEIVELFSRQSFYPKERRSEYAWIEQRPADGLIGLWLNGWKGTIEDLTKTSDGWIVKVSVWPTFANDGHAYRHLKNGIYTEEYKLSNNSLSFVKAHEPKNPGQPIGVSW